MFKFIYSVGDIKNSDLGEGIVCLGEGSGGKGGGKWGKGGREVGEKGEGSGGKGGGKWGMPTPLSTPSILLAMNMCKIVGRIQRGFEHPFDSKFQCYRTLQQVHFTTSEYVYNCWVSGKQTLIRRIVLRRLIWVYTVCSGLSVRIRRVSTVI